EATGDHAVLELLADFDALHKIGYSSLAVTLHARHLVAHLSRGTRFPLDHFDEAYTPLRLAELERDEARPWEGVGCWHPVFQGRVQRDGRNHHRSLHALRGPGRHHGSDRSAP